MSNNTTCPDYTVYKCYDYGLILPLTNESTWSIGFRAFIYLLGLLWCFLGVSIIADYFMCAIEKITSKTRKIKVAKQNTGDENDYEEIEVRVWNDTVANLTLMALGSSAPEILLSVYGIIKNRFEAEALGPSTIVGSAAFNLLCIIAVCIMAIPSPEVRQIKSVKVFAITSFTSIFAYVWLIIILVGITPNVVDLWEAVITFLFFPILVIVAYIADKDFCTKKQVDDNKIELGFVDEKEHHSLEDGDVDKEALAEFLKEIGKHPDLSEEEMAKLAALKYQENVPHNRAWYRINATRGLTGGNKLVPTMKKDLQDIYEAAKHHEPEKDRLASQGSLTDLSEKGTRAVIEFTATSCAVLENEKRVRIGIRRSGKLDSKVIFRVETIDGTAEATKDYIPVKTSMVFEPNETSKYIDIEIIDDNEWEPDETFFVRLSLDADQNAVIGKKSINQVTIINDDEPGTIQFAKPSFLFKESAGKAMIPVQRIHGADGKVNITWRTEDMDAKSGKDFEGGEGILTFEHGEVTKMLEITVYDDQEMEKDESFKVELFDPTGGAQLGRIKKTIITLVNDDEFNGMVSRVVELTNLNIDSLRVETETWAEQFQNAMNVNGGDIENATSFDYLMHFLSFGFKIIFAIVAPVSIAGGFLAFFMALAMIGIVTIIVSDLASIFGCLCSMPEEIVAITFVALGTSLPDLFASKQAAAQEKHADNAIGNVTGSNSVNVFLGLGLPWLIAAIYHTANNGSFQVQAGNLVFSVIIYTICATLCIGLILIRRFLKFFNNGELGGPAGPKMASGIFLIFLWFFYITMSILQTTKVIRVNL
ncbi:sodium/calcium exchanger 1 isoform X2 [Lingula anatina]|uniref:Sodium/calcium exchanger 1 isoform X2 n=1 Tax=Lingula anatina TaxID=7574 RepID=A0A1S3HPB9_LINAN|nr:sodium/calcium exchanger 1 isoform X2 [Lingula anatina]|eukprot:XP_013386884.1 sodium/calcium exchanger 1 isoform X2 [Lingula anatina]